MLKQNKNKVVKINWDFKIYIVTLPFINNQLGHNGCTTLFSENRPMGGGPIRRLNSSQTNL